jgi:hypothetical protein
VTYVPGDKSDIKPGAKVFIVAVKQADGTLLGRAWRVGRDGITPRRCECAGACSGATASKQNSLFRCGAAAKYGLDHLSFFLWRGGRVVECTALEIRLRLF